MNILFVLLDFLDNIDFTIVISVVLGIMVSIITFYDSFIVGRKSNSTKEEAFDLIISRYVDNVLDADFVRLIYEEKASKGLDVSFEDFLKSFIIYVSKKEAGKGNTIDGIDKVVKPLILKEKTIKPYSNLEEEERQLLLSIDSYIKNEGGDVPESVKYNLDGLALKIEKNQKALKASKRRNWISYVIGVIGIILTIYSFIRKPSISEESIKSISTEISMQMDSILKQNVYVDTVHEFVGDEVAN